MNVGSGTPPNTMATGALGFAQRLDASKGQSTGWSMNMKWGRFLLVSTSITSAGTAPVRIRLTWNLFRVRRTFGEGTVLLKVPSTLARHIARMVIRMMPTIHTSHLIVGSGSAAPVAEHTNESGHETSDCVSGLPGEYPAHSSVSGWEGPSDE